MHRLTLAVKAAFSVGATQAILLHQLYAVHDTFLEIENHTPKTAITINGERFIARNDSRLAIPCSPGEVLSVRWEDQETGVLCRTRLYIGL